MKMYKKELIFDLDTKMLKIYYPNENWRNAYNDIRKHMISNGFDWIQGSAYISRRQMTSLQIQKLLQDLLQANQWLHSCMRDCKETNVIGSFDRTYLFDKTFKIPTREEIEKERTQVQKNSILKKLEYNKSLVKKNIQDETRSVQKER